MEYILALLAGAFGVRLFKDLGFGRDRHDRYLIRKEISDLEDLQSQIRSESGRALDAIDFAIPMLVRPGKADDVERLVRLLEQLSDGLNGLFYQVSKGTLLRWSENPATVRRAITQLRQACDDGLKRLDPLCTSRTERAFAHHQFLLRDLRARCDDLLEVRTKTN